MPVPLLLTALGVLPAAALIVYFWPAPRKDFAELFAAVEPQTRQSLLDFRAQRPLRRIRVDGQTWEYTAFGEGETAILFLHGMTGAYDIWWRQMEALSGQHRVVSLTYPPVNTLEGLSRGALAVLDAEGITRAAVAGSSLGGYLAQYLLAQHPERIEKAALGNTFPPNDLLRRKNEGRIRALPFLPEWLVMRVFRSHFEAKIYPAAGYSELVLAYMLEQAAGRMSKAQAAARAKAAIEPFALPNPAAAGIPVMIIEADNDPLVEPALREQLRAAYPAAEVHTLHAAGHFPYLNAAETYTGLLRAFLER